MKSILKYSKIKVYLLCITLLTCLACSGCSDIEDDPIKENTIGELIDASGTDKTKALNEPWTNNEFNNMWRSSTELFYEVTKIK